ncbi:MAG: flagellar basal body rod protein FlgC [Nitrospinae bacterium]|nr:flagellar basal body rod protein FlgC [Nitrospinota bacterium]
MDLMTAMKVSAAGLSAQRTRMNVVSSNLANINTTRTPEGGPYRRKEVILTAAPAEDSFGKILAEQVSEPKVVTVAEDQSEFQKVYDPAHPDADAEGYVSMPNVNLMKEMVDMLSATRAYEANAAVINTVKTMAQRAIDIGNR